MSAFRVRDPDELPHLRGEAEQNTLLWRLDEEHQDDILLLPRLVNRWRVILLVSWIDDDILRYSIQHGVSAVLPDGHLTASETADVVALVGRGGTYFPDRVHVLLRDALRLGSAPEREPGPVTPRERLSKREQDIMNCIARGLSNDEIARELFISKKTVKNHINRMFAKLGARHRAEAMAIWLGFGSSYRGEPSSVVSTGLSDPTVKRSADSSGPVSTVVTTAISTRIV